MMSKVKLQIIGSGAIFATDASASALIDDNILVDCGAGTFKQLLRLGCDVAKIDTILITHLHADHFMDVPFMMLAAKKNGQKLTIFLPEGGAKATHEIAKYIWSPEGATESWWPQNVELVEYQNGVNFATNGATVEPVKVVHGELRASGFIVEKAGKKIGFSGDSIMCDGIQKIVEASDWAVLDTSCPKSGSAIHMGLDDIYGLCRTYPDKKIVATHLFEETRKTIQQDVANLIVPNDGDVFEL